MFLLPGLVITWYVTETPIPSPVATEIKRYLLARQHPQDGGWGLHIEGESSVFGTAMNYVVMRLLGASSEDSRMIKARGKLYQLGGAANGPHWAKFWLSVLGCAEWDIVNPVPPELWYVKNTKFFGIMEVSLMAKAAPRLGPGGTLAMVDPHASGLPSHVIHCLQRLPIPTDPTDKTTSGRTVHTTVLINQLCLFP